MAFRTTTAVPRQFQALFDVIYGTASVNFGDVASGAEVAADVTVTGAALGDIVLAASQGDLANISVTANVRAANIVELTAQNQTGDHVNLAAQTWNIVVLRPKGDFAVV